MFDAEVASCAPALHGDGVENTVEDIIWRSDLPDTLKHASLSYVASRCMDAKEIERLTNETLNLDGCPAMRQRLEDREKALRSVENKDIACALIKLPGSSYTIEIDVQAGKIVHWEYEAT